MSDQKGGCDITGSHTYAEETTTKFQVTYFSKRDAGGQMASNSATVTDAPLSVSAQNITATAGSGFSGTVGSFTDSAAMEPTANYSATVDWGDGTSTAGSVDSAGHVSGSHAYSSAGSFTLHVTVHDEGGASDSGAATASVAAAGGSGGGGGGSASCPAAAQTAAPPFTPLSTDAPARWTEALYHDLLGRPATGGDVALGTSLLGGGLTHSQVASLLLGASEYRLHLIAGFYASYLHRIPTPTDDTVMLALLSGGTDEQVQEAILSSPEYYANRGGGTQQGWAQAVFCDLLGRNLGAADQSALAGLTGSGASRSTLVSLIVGSPEYRGRLVNGLYQRLLRRAIDPIARTALLTYMGAGATDEQIIALIVSSPEYMAMFNGGGTVLSLHISLGGIIVVTLPRPATLDLVVLRLTGPLPPGPGPVPSALPARAGTAAATQPPTRKVGTVRFGRKRAGRVTVRWNRKVRGHRLKPGTYLLIVRAHAGGRIIATSDPVTFRVHRGR